MIELRESTKDEINHRAYALYLMRGCEQGREVEDWLRAEKELSDESAGEPITEERVRSWRVTVSLACRNLTPCLSE